MVLLSDTFRDVCVASTVLLALLVESKSERATRQVELEYDMNVFSNVIGGLEFLANQTKWRLGHTHKPQEILGTYRHLV